MNVADRVQETTTTTGTGTVTLAGAVTGFRTFTSAFTTGTATIGYCITDGTNWEVGRGTLATSSTLSRDTIIASSNSNAAVSFAAGTKQVFCTATSYDLNNPSSVNMVGESFAHVDRGTVSSGTVTFDYSAGTSQRLQVGGALTIAMSNLPASGKRAFLLLEIVNGGSATVTMPTVNWVKPDGTTTTTFSTYLTAAGRTALQTSGTDFLILWTRDAGTTVYGKVV